MTRYIMPISDDSDYFYREEQDEGFIVERIHCQTGMCYHRVKEIGTVEPTSFEDYIDVAQHDAERRYYAKMSYVTLKISKEQHDRFKACAKEAKMSTAGFIKYCAARYMDYVESEFFEGEP
jgi:hypothetical protein